MIKNTASQIVGAQMITAADGTAFTGAVTCYYTLNGGSQTIGSVGSGACTHEGNGFHTYTPSAAETNGDHCAYTFIGSGAIPATVQIYTTLVRQSGDSYPVVSHTDYGNAKLVRSATPGNALAVDAGGLVAVPTTQKVDVETIKTAAVAATATVTFQNGSVPITSSVMSANLTQILGVAIAGTAADIAAAFGTFFNVTGATATVANITSILGKWTGITSLAQWLGAMAAKHTPNATAVTEINATGAGDGGYDPATDSGEGGADRVALQETLTPVYNWAADALMTRFISVYEWTDWTIVPDPLVDLLDATITINARNIGLDGTVYGTIALGNYTKAGGFTKTYSGEIPEGSVFYWNYQAGAEVAPDVAVTVNVLAANNGSPRSFVVNMPRQSAFYDVDGWVTNEGITVMRGSGALTTKLQMTAQEIRDTGKLAPSAGAPAAGSVDAHLDTIEAAGGGGGGLGEVDVSTEQE